MKSVLTWATLAVLLGMAASASAQISFSEGNNAFQVGLITSGYYNQRFYKKGETDLHKNGFVLRDAMLDFRGYYGRRVEYAVQFEVFQSVVDVENPVLKDAWVSYDFGHQLKLTAGYQKLPYSRASNISTFQSPFWTRAELARGDFFRRRDVGFTLQKGYFRSRLNLFAGLYTGLGEQTLAGSNDVGGRPEVVARAEYAYPARYRDREVDVNHSIVPHFALAANARHANKSAYSGTAYKNNPIATINGDKTVMGGDFALMYRGFTVNVEAHQALMTPRDTLVLLAGQASHTRHVRAGGFLVGANYYCKPLKSVFAVRYDTFNPNDLVLGDELPNLTFAYNLLMRGYGSAIRVQYSHRLKAKDAATAWDVDQLRIGYQLQLR